MTKEEKEKILDELATLRDNAYDSFSCTDYTSGRLRGIIDAEEIIEDIPTTEPKEINLEHYLDEITKSTGTTENPYEVGNIMGLVYHKYSREENIVVPLAKMFGWYLSAYEKPKCKLTQFEYDLLRTNDMSHDRTVGSFATYRNMHKVGYFQDIDMRLTINEILENSEVEDND